MVRQERDFSTKHYSALKYLRGHSDGWAAVQEGSVILAGYDQTFFVAADGNSEPKLTQETIRGSVEAELARQQLFPLLVSS